MPLAGGEIDRSASGFLAARGSGFVVIKCRAAPRP
jgi:hypothetical protein